MLTISKISLCRLALLFFLVSLFDHHIYKDPHTWGFWNFLSVTPYRYIFAEEDIYPDADTYIIVVSAFVFFVVDSFAKIDSSLTFNFWTQHIGIVFFLSAMTKVINIKSLHLLKETSSTPDSCQTISLQKSQYKCFWLFCCFVRLLLLLCKSGRSLSVTLRTQFCWSGFIPWVSQILPAPSQNC